MAPSAAMPSRRRCVLAATLVVATVLLASFFHSGLTVAGATLPPGARAPLPPPSPSPAAPAAPVSTPVAALAPPFKPAPMQPRYSSSNSTRPPALPRVAMAVQLGRDEEAARWRALFAHMRCAPDVDLFVFLWRADAAADVRLAAWAAEANTSLAHYSTPRTRDAGGSPYNSSRPPATWTEGRNELAQAIYAREVARGRQYAAWAMLDGDRARLTCHHQCWSTAKSPEARAWLISACCIEHVLAPALAYGFASVASSPAFPSDKLSFPAAAEGQQDAREWSFYFNAMADAQFQVFNRDAVPVLLPYYAGLDAQSWWLSQYALFFFANGCVRDASVVAVQFGLQPVEEEHEPYPSGLLEPPAVLERVVAAFPALADTLSEPFAADRWRIRLDPEHVVRWRETEAFKRCWAVREPQFVAEIGRGVPQAPRDGVELGWRWPWSGNAYNTGYWHWVSEHLAASGAAGAAAGAG